MRACPACGASNGPGDDFCGNCGAYLGWSEGSGTREPEAPGAPAPGGGAPPATAGSGPETADRERPDDSAGTTTAPGPATATAPGTGPSVFAEEAAPPDPAAGPVSTPATPSPAPAPPPPPIRPAPSPAPRPPAPEEPPVQDPVPVLPAKAVAPRPVVRPTAPADEVSGTPCPACGTPNQPGRRFCRRCAAELRPTADPEALPWWRTVWPFRRKVRASSGRLWRFLVVLVVVLALCAGGFLLLPAGRALIEDTRDKLGKAKPVTPVNTEASAEIPRHPATGTTDGLSNRYWGAPSAGASVTYTFGKSFRLVDLIITNGASGKPQEYARQGRALRMDMEVTTEDGGTERREISLSDKPGPQTVAVQISDVRTVRLVLRSPAGQTEGRHLALAEVEFFQRS
ncbi:NADase-type glycan-binding domain-containing protein [Streptomyces sp. NPDC048590]|uniref:NADase-type glycan-binding domain-containing protein n=1 Tax=Streptomyces sp. NPDC048590 TaxID=3365574 RepID=UPI003712E7FF